MVGSTGRQAAGITGADKVLNLRDPSFPFPAGAYFAFDNLGLKASVI